MDLSDDVSLIGVLLKLDAKTGRGKGGGDIYGGGSPVTCPPYKTLAGGREREFVCENERELEQSSSP